MGAIAKDARKLGFNRRDIIEAMTSSGISEKDAKLMISGRYQRFDYEPFPDR